jgi:dolichol-phosphate mannosyltransferase
VDSRADRAGDHLSAPRDEPLLIVVPVYNEGENIEALVRAVEAGVQPPFSLHVVYDFDEDNTVPVVEGLQATRPWLKLHKNTRGRGVVHALRAGFDLAERGPILVMMGDLSDDIRVVDEMVRRYRAGADVVCASRYMRGGQQLGGPWLKGFLARAAGISLHTLVRFPTHDATNNFRLYDAAFVREVGIESAGGFEVALELTAKAFRAGRRIDEVPSTWRDRSAGTSRFQLRKWLPQYLRWYVYALTGRR